MEPIPLSIQTLYADLAQAIDTAPPDEATVVATTVKGVRYLRLQRWVGASRTVEHLGRADDPEVAARGDRARLAMYRRRERRRLVRTLRGFAGGPGAKLGRVLDALAYAGLFERGGVLVGTAAYQCYPFLVGHRLSASSLMTQDADLATADLTLSGTEDGVDFTTILRRADPGFTSVRGLNPRALPSRFRAPDGFVVDLLTLHRRASDPNPMPLTRLRAGATPLQHLDWLIEAPVRAVALHGPGIPVTVPQPARYAVHKLIVAQKRPATDAAKRGKDLVQAKALMNALAVSAPFDLEDALDEARARGRTGWAKPIDRSLRQIDSMDAGG